ncbi:WD40 repeat-like protein [Penicillium malachiteum]|uniref:WD40 repeat-like protein n=1 Tax=Penicillium malachiteum TaxID=1324776 RepID=A0AAD6MSC7_9EURO|nr:WD40 repeat-like protein [Penicillium malachiteum]
MGRFTRLKNRILPRSGKRQVKEAQPNKHETRPDHTPITQESEVQEPVNPGKTNNAQSQPSDPSSQQDLWQCAFEQLEQKDQEELRSHFESSSDEQVKDDFQPKSMVEQVIEATKDAYEEHQKTGGKIVNTALSVQVLINRGVACDPTGHAASAWAVVSFGLTMTQNHKDRQDALLNAAEYLAEVLGRCTHYEVNFLQPQFAGNKMVRCALIRVYKEILQCTANVKMTQKQHTGEKLLDSFTAITSQRLGQNQSSIEKAEQELYQLVQFDNFKRHDAAAEKILTAIDDRLLKCVNNLVLHFGIPIAEGAVLGFYENERDNVSMCLADTRVDVLLEISAWAESSDAKFFWLNGMAGTGKSTLARTVAIQEAIGSCFFFKKDDAERGNAKRFISTIAKQLMSQSHQLASFISDAVNKDSQIASKALSEQFRKLLFKPLQDMTEDPNRVIIIVVDALDECTEKDLQINFRLLLELQKIKNIRLKIFLTGRPERQIFQGIEGIMFDQDRKDLQGLALHEVEESVIEHDVRLFLRNGLGSAREKNPSLRSTTWPTDDAIEKLVRKSVPLFIYAATLCRFIDGKQLPQKRLDTILQSHAPYYVPQMQIMYQVVLEQLLDPEDATESKKT